MSCEGPCKPMMLEYHRYPDIVTFSRYDVHSTPYMGSNGAPRFVGNGSIQLSVAGIHGFVIVNWVR